MEYERPAYRPIQTTVYQQPEELDYVCLQRGPIVFALDSALGIPADASLDLCLDCAEISDGNDERVKAIGINPSIICRVTDKQYGTVTLIDYASAGKDWNTEIAAWLKCERN